MIFTVAALWSWRLPASHDLHCCCSFIMTIAGLPLLHCCCFFIMTIEKSPVLVSCEHLVRWWLVSKLMYHVWNTIGVWNILSLTSIYRTRFTSVYDKKNWWARTPKVSVWLRNYGRVNSNHPRRSWIWENCRPLAAERRNERCSNCHLRLSLIGPDFTIFN